MMRVLIAEDDVVSRYLLQKALTSWGYEVVATEDGGTAWQVLQQDDAPPLAILDWMMPVMDGVQVCRHVHQLGKMPPLYIILLTAREGTDNIIEGLQAGANDYITKPFDLGELQARVRVGEAVVRLQNELATRVRELALAQVNRLQGLLPICSYCKKVRDDQNYWHEVEVYVRDHANVDFSHGICPHCYETRVKPELELLRSQRGRS